MVSVTSAARYIMSVLRYHPRYQSRSSMCICGLIPGNITELAEAVPIGLNRGYYNFLNVYGIYSTG